mmetsp:Transcript_38144/g.100955  ORF Transcript_38144/g.100955 Transcript_38144/m.100955 type:complete len:84 (+) Transcript_38144:178-429(+)
MSQSRSSPSPWLNSSGNDLSPWGSMTDPLKLLAGPVDPLVCLAQFLLFDADATMPEPLDNLMHSGVLLAVGLHQLLLRHSQAL